MTYPTNGSASAMAVAEARIAKPHNKGIHVETFTSKCAQNQAGERKSITKIAAKRLRQAQHIAKGEAVIANVAGWHIGKELAAVALRRYLMAGKDDQTIFDLVAFLSGGEACMSICEREARANMLYAVINTLTSIARAAHEHGAFSVLPFDEDDALNRGAKLAQDVALARRRAQERRAA